MILQVKIQNEQSRFLFHKPKSFLTARNLIYATIFTGLLGFTVRESNVGIAKNGGIIAITITIFGYVLIWLLFKLMSQCKRWARTVLLILYIMVIISFITLLKSRYVASKVEIALIIIQRVLMIVTLIFLYKKECNIWFNNKSGEILP